MNCFIVCYCSFIDKSQCKIKFSLRVNDVKYGYLKLKLDQAQFSKEDIVPDSWHDLKSKRHKEQIIGKLCIGVTLNSDLCKESMSKLQGTNVKPQIRHLITKISTGLISRRSSASLDSTGNDSSEACNQSHDGNVKKSLTDDMSVSKKRSTLRKRKDNSNSNDSIRRKDSTIHHDLRTKDSLNDDKNKHGKPLLNQSGTTSEGNYSYISSLSLQYFCNTVAFVIK